MRPSLFILSAVLLAGCASISTSDRQQLRSASERFSSITKGMTREQIESVLGAPQKSGPTELIWEIRAGRENFEVLTVGFDARGEAVAVRQSSRRHWGWSTSKSETKTTQTTSATTNTSFAK